MPTSVSSTLPIAPTTSPSVSAARRKVRNPWLRVLTILNGLGLVLLWWLANVIGEHTNPTTVLLYMPQHPLVVPTLLLLLASVWKLNYPLFACNLWVLCAWIFSFGGVQVPWPFWKSSSPTIRVVTWNIRDWKPIPQLVTAKLAELSLDIICLEEVRDLSLLSTMVAPGSTSPFSGWHCLTANDVAILSRFPLLSSRTEPVPGSWERHLIAAQWQTPQGPFTTVTVHVSTALKPGEAPPYHEYNKPQRWKEVVRNAKKTAQVRATQWDTIQNSIVGVSGPFLIAGDFNNPPRGLLYHRLTHNWKDAFAQGGWGSGFTFPASHPLMRIDYVWVNPSTRVQRCFVPETRASDHLPLVADLSF